MLEFEIWHRPITVFLERSQGARDAVLQSLGPSMWYDSIFDYRAEHRFLERSQGVRDAVLQSLAPATRKRPAAAPANPPAEKVIKKQGEGTSAAASSAAPAAPAAPDNESEEEWMPPPCLGVLDTLPRSPPEWQPCLSQRPVPTGVSPWLMGRGSLRFVGTALYESSLSYRNPSTSRKRNIAAVIKEARPVRPCLP